MRHRKFYGHLESDGAMNAYQQRLFRSLQEVYDTGARNFLFIDVPPIERAPGCEILLVGLVFVWSLIW